MKQNHFISENKNLSLLYDKYKEFFIKFAAKNFTIDRDTIDDIYQESFVVMYEKMQQGKLPTSVSFQTYLFAVGKYKILNYLRDNHLDLSGISEDILRNNTFYEPEDWIQKQEIVYQEVCKMQEPCNRILSFYYYDRKSMKEIADFFNYENEQVAKNRKYLCIQKLKEIIMVKLKKENLI